MCQNINMKSDHVLISPADVLDCSGQPCLLLPAKCAHRQLYSKHADACVPVHQARQPAQAPVMAFVDYLDYAPDQAYEVQFAPYKLQFTEVRAGDCRPAKAWRTQFLSSSSHGSCCTPATWLPCPELGRAPCGCPGEAMLGHKTASALLTHSCSLVLMGLRRMRGLLRLTMQLLPAHQACCPRPMRRPMAPSGLRGARRGRLPPRRRPLPHSMTSFLRCAQSLQ